MHFALLLSENYRAIGEKFREGVVIKLEMV